MNGDVPVVWAAAPGPLIGGLTFRVGQMDESLVRRGATHLIEHLALHDLDVRYSYNGSTGQAFTNFFARGEEEEVAHVLNHVVNRLADLPWNRVPTEASVLRAEGANRNSIQALSLFLRYGPRGPGLAHIRELGLERPDPQFLAYWRDRYFTSGNACLWFAGERPVEVNTGVLPPGTRAPVVPIAQSLPFGRRLHVEQMSGTAVSFAVRRDNATNLAIGLLHKRLNDVLRRDLGLVYGVSSSLDWYGDVGDATVVAECSAENQTKVHNRLLLEMTRFAYDGPTVEERRSYIEFLRRGGDDPATSSQVASGAAENVLSGRPIRVIEEWLTELERCDSAAVADVVGRALDYALWLVSPQTEIVDRRFQNLPQWSLLDVLGEGKIFVQKDAKSPSVPGQLFVGRGGVKLLAAGRQDPSLRVAMPIEAIAAMLAFADGRRFLWSTEGFSLAIRPEEWENGQTLPGLIDAVVPADRVVWSFENSSEEDSLSLYSPGAGK